MEDKLIELSQKGNLDAFEKLIMSYERKIYVIAYRFMGNEHDAKDLTQETFIKAFKNIKSFRKESSFSTWICRIASNACKDELRKIKRKPCDSLDEEVNVDDGYVYKQIEDKRPTPEEIYESAELNKYLQQMLNELNSDYRMVIVLRDIEGYSYEEIAEITNVSLGTVKSRLNRARKELKEKISSGKKGG
ncbi:RNA polymerase, sigma-24 subunit, RpoE [Desulfonispora thiosulfatigenes DSM 11270]|uniref:RNA polymerase, sigma-24 subunit, RpoE n=1 Tax=Desulfonispora thiosulfatigenes DSM 11270 TaxID=656914 RepID=A0A1W1VHR5_DESTI|nr:sigma-70 family RNA polymerase sigma factor [Desulfonispora thiosulfatigenes]SMB92907.1 RNA polymerase, sigma-24 subunit, RpoE [Desulfonispora thiosulfatigenes DSM 11270]